MSDPQSTVEQLLVDERDNVLAELDTDQLRRHDADDWAFWLDVETYHELLSESTRLSTETPFTFDGHQVRNFSTKPNTDGVVPTVYFGPSDPAQLPDGLGFVETPPKAYVDRCLELAGRTRTYDEPRVHQEVHQYKVRLPFELQREVYRYDSEAFEAHDHCRLLKSLKERLEIDGPITDETFGGAEIENYPEGVKWVERRSNGSSEYDVEVALEYEAETIARFVTFGYEVCLRKEAIADGMDDIFEDRKERQKRALVEGVVATADSDVQTEIVATDATQKRPGDVIADGGEELTGYTETTVEVDANDDGTYGMDATAEHEIEASVGTTIGTKTTEYGGLFARYASLLEEHPVSAFKWVEEMTDE